MKDKFTNLIGVNFTFIFRSTKDVFITAVVPLFAISFAPLEPRGQLTNCTLTQKDAAAIGANFWRIIAQITFSKSYSLKIQQSKSPKSNYPKISFDTLQLIPTFAISK
jgi:hypothetical protein